MTTVTPATKTEASRVRLDDEPPDFPTGKCPPYLQEIADKEVTRLKRTLRAWPFGMTLNCRLEVDSANTWWMVFDWEVVT